MLNEQILGVLKRDSEANDSTDIDSNDRTTNKVSERFTLFDDPSCPILTREGKKAIGNADYRAEAEQKKLKEARQNGIAPWSFADVRAKSPIMPYFQMISYFLMLFF